jgi:CheY-like chemotaxis protein
MTIAILTTKDSHLKKQVEKILTDQKEKKVCSTVETLYAWFKKQENQNIPLIVCDSGIVDEHCITEGENLAIRIRSHSDAGFAQSPLILFGLEDIGERIFRNPLNWCWRYFARCILSTEAESKLIQAVTDISNPLHDVPPAPDVFQTKWAGRLNIYARIDEYLCFFCHHDTEQQYYLTVITRFLTGQNEISHALDPTILRKLIKAPLKRMESHDMKTASIIGQITLLEGALFAGHIPKERFRTCIENLLHEKTGYPKPVVNAYLRPCDTVPDVSNGRVLADTMRNKNILLVDDHAEQWESVLQTIFYGSKVKSIREPFDEAAFKKKVRQSDLIFLDLYFNNIPANMAYDRNRYDRKAFGLHILDNWFDQNPTLPVLLFTTSERSDQARHSLSLGANDFISKEKSDDTINPQAVFTDFASAVISHVQRATFIKPIWESVSWLQSRGCDTFNLREAVNAFYAQTTVFACRSNLHPFAQAIVSLNTFIEANQMKKRIKPQNVSYFISNARNMIAHGNNTNTAEIDLILLFSALLVGLDQKEQANKLATGYLFYLRNNHDILKEIHRAGYNIHLPDSVTFKNIQTHCHHIWEKICSHHTGKKNCIQTAIDAIPNCMFLSDNQKETPNFIKSSPLQCLINNQCRVPYFSRRHQVTQFKENVFCVYHGKNPKNYLFFDLLVILLSNGFRSPEYLNFVYLAALRLENLYLRHFANECGPLDQLLFHIVEPTG